MYISGDKSPSELCGRNSLYSLRQASIFSRASSRERNQCTFRHSSRKLPLNDSIFMDQNILDKEITGRIISFELPCKHFSLNGQIYYITVLKNTNQFIKL